MKFENSWRVQSWYKLCTSVNVYRCLAVKGIIRRFSNSNSWLIWLQLKINAKNPGESELILKNPWKTMGNYTFFLKYLRFLVPYSMLKLKWNWGSHFFLTIAVKKLNSYLKKLEANLVNQNNLNSRLVEHKW